MALLALMLVGLLAFAGIVGCSGEEEVVEEVEQTTEVVEGEEEVEQATEVAEGEEEVVEEVEQATEAAEGEEEVVEEVEPATEVAEGEEEAEEVEEADKIKVVTTTNFVADWVENVGGNRVEVFSLVPTGADPHGFQPGARDVARVADADLVFSVGLGLEDSWLNDLLQNAARDPSRIVALTDSIEPIEFGETHREDVELIAAIEEIVHEVEEGHLSAADAIEEIEHLLAAKEEGHDDHDDHDHDDHDEEDDHDDQMTTTTMTTMRKMTTTTMTTMRKMTTTTMTTMRKMTTTTMTMEGKVLPQRSRP